MYDKPVYVTGLIDTMRRCGIGVDSTILDAGCGTGFPLIELVKRGYRVTGVDKNIEMVNTIPTKAHAAGVSVDIAGFDWTNLPNNFGKCGYDFVYCRGNSLVYADSWAEKLWSADSSRAAIRIALRNFYEIITPGGMLYVDIPSHREWQDWDVERVVGYSDRKHHDLKVLWIVRRYTSCMMRTVNILVLSREHGEVAHYKLLSYFLQHEEMMQMLRDAGFADIQPQVDVVGESHYDVYLARK